MEFCQANGLLAVYENGVNVSGGYMDPAKRNIKAIKLRGEKSDGLFLPLTCFEYTGIDISTLTIGTQITVVNGKEICQKYIPRVDASTVAGGAGKRGPSMGRRQSKQHRSQVRAIGQVKLLLTGTQDQQLAVTLPQQSAGHMAQ